METIIPGVHQVSYGYVNSLIIDGDDGITLVDTGLPKREGAVTDALSEIGRSITDVTAIVITHSHADHAGSAAALQRLAGAPVYASSADSAAISGKESPPPPPFTGRLPFLKPLFRLLPGAEGVAVDHVIGEGAYGKLPGDLTVIDTPGHTPGHVSFLLDRAGGLLCVGDAAMATKRGTVKRGWMNRPEPVFDESLRHMAEFDFEIACFGHAAPLRSGASAAFKRFAESLA